ncbi:MAG: hypothetical protein HPY85_15620 [Anaerolineae bacterium]|nr:hypothetical protein [Anaerolineae bacterium]
MTNTSNMSAPSLTQRTLIPGFAERRKAALALHSRVDMLRRSTLARPKFPLDIPISM